MYACIPVGICLHTYKHTHTHKYMCMYTGGCVTQARAGNTQAGEGQSCFVLPWPL